MATDATGTPTSPDNIPTFNTAVDAPSGKGFNAAMAAIQTALSARVSAPAGIATGEVPVWNGTTWARSTTTRISASSLAASPAITTFLRGDSTWQKGGINLLYDSVDAGVTLPAATITTPSLDQSFAHLVIVIYAKGDNAGSIIDTKLRFNGDVGANYLSQQITANAAAVSAAEQVSQTSIEAGFLAAAGAAAGHASSIFGVIANYAGTAFDKEVVTMGMASRGITTTGGWLNIQGGVWASTAAITSLTFFPSAGNFITGSRFSVYGIPG